MKVWQIILVAIGITMVAYLYFGDNEPQRPIVFVRNSSDSLYKIIDSLKSKEDSLIPEIKTLSQNKQKVIKVYYEKDDNIRSLNAGNSIRLFAEWNRQLQDSSYKTRYFRISTDTIHN